LVESFLCREALLFDVGNDVIAQVDAHQVLIKL
jgi:hypothetical protein